MGIKVHNGIYTLQNEASGEHHTFRIRTLPKNSKFAPGKRTIALLSGPDNNHGYTQFGFVNDSGIVVWRKKRHKDDWKWSKWQWFAWMVWDLFANKGKELGARGKAYDVQSSRHCIRCNRRLTTPTSIENGIGPECMKLSPV